MTRVYAAPADFTTYTGQATTADTPRLLQRASQFLESEVFRSCYYQADPVTGMPTDPGVIAAFRDATCAQVEWWAGVGDNIGIGGIGTYDQVHIGTVRLMSSKQVGDVVMSAARQVAPSVGDVLRTADLSPEVLRIGMVVGW